MTQPDFLIIPTTVREKEGLRPTDWIVYGVVYWYEQMRAQKCTASNESIGAVAHVTDRAVRSALERLEKAGFIKRHFFDEDRKKRAEIRCIVKYGVFTKEPERAQAELPGIPAPTYETPGEFSKRFFSGDQGAQREVIDELILKSQGRIQEQPLVREVAKFCAYWTEPNKSGTKVKWQMQPTFDVRRRLYTWLDRTGQRSRAVPRAGAGVSV